MELNRRELLATFLGVPAALAAGCADRPPMLPPAGSIIGGSDAIGHKLRDGFRPVPAADRWQQVGVVIVGGGIAGLSAAWRLQRAGFDDFVVLELEPEPGGTSRGGMLNSIPCPWGAHYLPAPLGENRALLALLDEMQIIEGRDADGEPMFGEQFLCRDPQERIFHQGRWYEGLYLHEGETPDDQRQWAEFGRLVDELGTWRDARGRRGFAIPAAFSSDDPRYVALDQMSMADWLTAQRFDSERLRWQVDYACRDDYGLRPEQTSAWAGLFYFGSRLGGSGADAQPLLTWPEGNGRLVRHLSDRVSPRVQTGRAVSEIVPDRRGGEEAEVVCVSRTGEEVTGFRARHILFCAPQFLAPYLIRGYSAARGEVTAEFEYGSWMVANLYLEERPKSIGFPLAWDNVFYDSPSLGYVTATHQQGIDHGPTVLTYYFPLCDESPRAARKRLLSLSWKEWAEVVLSDMQRAHPEIRRLTKRLDVMRWGHAMIRPRPGFRTGTARQFAAQPFGNIHFANTDLSGMALFEEAFYQGLRGAEEVLRERGVPFDRMV
ncbi:MAG: FAD-dependent oxidoreductase [Planctomycetales bacterium]